MVVVNICDSYNTGNLVYYVGPPILSPQDWARIVSHNNGVIDFNDVGVIITSDNFLKIADIYFQQSEIYINRISYKYLIKID